MAERSDRKMDEARLAVILEAYGADSRRWPEDERAAARALLAGSAEARALRDAAEALDTLLDVPAPPAPSPELMAAILAAAERPSWRQWLVDLWPIGPIWQPASAFAAAIVLGIAIGVGAPDLVLPNGGDALITEAESLAFGPAFIAEDAL
ncbi:MAG: hypothetical protein JSU82_16040 [Rhodospirillales bacterium]|nr:MAG: hypothetical protein JSU82_16040 [Rhodospirillales bacterium]